MTDDLELLKAALKPTDLAQYLALLEMIRSRKVLTDAQQRKFDVYEATIEQHRSGSNNFPNLLAVHRHLLAQGWKISQAGIYKHRDEGRIKPAKDGTYSPGSVDRYARTWLAHPGAPAGASPADPELSELERRRRSAMVDKEQAQAKIAAMRARLMEGAYVPREAMETELARRAAVLRADGEQFCRSQATAIVSILEADQARADDLAAYLLDQFETWFDRYSRQIEIEAIYPPNDAAEGECAGDPAAVAHVANEWTSP